MIEKVDWALARNVLLWVSLSGFLATDASAQSASETHPRPPGLRGSPNVHVLSHIPLGAHLTVSDIEMEQEPSRPYVYVSRRTEDKGFDVISIDDPENSEVIYN